MVGLGIQGLQNLSRSLWGHLGEPGSSPEQQRQLTNHALTLYRKKPKVISNKSRHIEVAWAEAPLVGTDFQTIPHLSGSVSLAPTWLLVESYEP